MKYCIFIIFFSPTAIKRMHFHVFSFLAVRNLHYEYCFPKFIPIHIASPVLKIILRNCLESILLNTGTYQIGIGRTIF